MTNAVKTFILLGSLTALLVFVGYHYLGTPGIIIAVVFSLLMNITSYWYSDSIILSLTNAKEYQIAQYTMLNAYIEMYCQKLNIPMPKFYLIDDPVPNAFATGRDPQHAIVCLTTGLLKLLTIEEQVAVIAHELGHIQSRDILIASIGAVMAGALSSMANIAYFGSFSKDERQGSSPLGFIITILIAPFVGILLQYALSRSREYAADEISARTLETSQPLISALTKIQQVVNTAPTSFNKGIAALCIVNAYTSREGLELFSTHPPLEKRIERLLKLGL